MNMAVSGRGQQGLIGVVKQQPPTQPSVLVLAPPQPNWQANVPTMQVRKRHFWAVFILKRTFCQDRLGTNIGKTQKKWRFLAATVMCACVDNELGLTTAGSTTSTRMW
jgi:hypothetical protein